MSPSTVQQLAILVAFVLPGSVYQAVRARLAGEVPANRDLSNRILRALAASVVLDGIYGIALGPVLVRWLDGIRQRRDLGWLEDHVRTMSLVGLLLLFVVPTALAYFAARRYLIGDWLSRADGRGYLSTNWGPPRARVRRRCNQLLRWLRSRCENGGGLRYDPTPTAWDWSVDHGGNKEGFVRVLSKGGAWHGGLFRRDSYFSAYPDVPAIFVQQAWQMSATGEFLDPQQGSKGAWIPCSDAVTVEFLHTEPSE